MDFAIDGHANKQIARTLSISERTVEVHRSRVMQKMELAATRTDGKSCLGLARIRCEAQMTIDCRIEAGRIRLLARRAL